MFRHNRHPRELTLLLLKHTGIRLFYNNHAYQMCKFQLEFTVFKIYYRSDSTVCCWLQTVGLLSS